MMFNTPPIGLAVSLACLLLFWVVGLLISQLYMVRENTCISSCRIISHQYIYIYISCFNLDGK